MPAVSQSQRRLFSIAEHHPEELYAKNRSLANQPHKVLHEFAATKGLKRNRVKKPVKVRMASMMRSQ